MPRVVVFDEFGGPEVLHVAEEPVAEPGAGEVRVRIEAFAVNPLDQMMRSAARELLRSRGLAGRPHRFDLVTVDLSPAGEPIRVRLHRAAM